MQLQAGTETLDLTGVEALIFDLDGTLVQSEHVWAKAKSEVAIRHGRSPTEADLELFVGRSVSDFVAIYLGISDELLRNQAIDQISDIALRQLQMELREIPGASSLVKSAHNAGLRIAICSSASSPAIRTSARFLGISDLVEITVSAAGMRYGKPHKQPYVETLKKLGLQPGQTIAFEDSVSGIRSALAAGIPTVCLGQHKTDRSDANFLAVCESLGDVQIR